MSQELARLLLAFVATFLMVRQATGAAPGSRRRLAFILGAAGFALLALGNAFPMLGFFSSTLLVGFVGLGVLLLVASLVTLFLAYRAGELNEQFNRAGTLLAQEREKSAERERRERERRKRPQ